MGKPGDFVLDHACGREGDFSARQALVTLNFAEGLVLDAESLPPDHDYCWVMNLVFISLSGARAIRTVCGLVMSPVPDDGVAEFIGLVRTKMNSIVNAI